MKKQDKEEFEQLVQKAKLSFSIIVILAIIISGTILIFSNGK